jgi:hypothetical protein
MAPPQDGPTPPEGLPDEVVATLTDLPPEQLRLAIVHAQELLQINDETGPPIEPGPDEDILRMEERDGYTEVVKRVPCAAGCDDCPHGPYIYHVTEEPRPEGGTHVHWSFIGRIEE